MPPFPFSSFARSKKQWVSICRSKSFSTLPTEQVQVRDQKGFALVFWHFAHCSAGALVVLALYGLGMRAEETFPLFTQLATRIFRGRSQLGLGLVATAHALITSCRNGRFPASDIDNALNEVFEEATMLDVPYMSSIGARVGLPVVEVDTLETYLVTSYNGAAPTYDDAACTEMSTYRVLRSKDATEEIRVKDA